MASIQSIKDDTIEIIYRGKKVVIEITKELSINENIINTQLKNHPSNYAFLCLLRDQYLRKRDSWEAKKDLAYSEAWIYYKESDSRLNNDTVNNKALTNKKYRSYLSKYQKVVDKYNKLVSICRAYESRERILQTIAANLRKQ